MTDMWQITEGTGCLVGAAIHDGHEIRPDVEAAMKLSEEGRLREEDPYTGRIAELFDTRIVVRRSRFEVDLNRPRDKAVYRRPEDAWGLEIWKDDELPESIVAESLAEYDAFNRDLFALLDRVRERCGRFVVYDLHSYNHRREGPEGPAADEQENPEINIGTKHIDVDVWRPVLDRFMEDLRHQPFGDHLLDVRENVKFGGGNFAARIRERYGADACVIAIEFKKVFMDEWSGEADDRAVEQLKDAVAATMEGVVEEVGRL